MLLLYAANQTTLCPRLRSNLLTLRAEDIHLRPPRHSESRRPHPLPHQILPTAQTILSRRRLRSRVLCLTDSHLRHSIYQNDAILVLRLFPNNRSRQQHTLPLLASARTSAGKWLPAPPMDDYRPHNRKC
jgi:hypothetical protein